jgi:DNA-binding NarL/FixJ family response regulator
VRSVSPINVLVVDESEAFLASMRRWIESCGDLRLVGVARDGHEALRAVELLRPDLVIVEAALSGMDGFRLACVLKERDDAPWVLLATFHASVAARDEAYAAGADGLVAKGDFSDEIEAILEEWRAGSPGPGGRVTTPAKPARRGSRTSPDP